MSRVVAAFGVLIGFALAGCSASPFSMPDWLTSKPSPPPLQTLQFISEPPGASVRSAQGQTCETPCSLPVPSESQSVTFAKNGFLSQTIQVSVGEPPEHSLFSRSPPPVLIPNPVEVALQPSRPTHKRAMKPRPAAHNLQQTAPPLPPPRQQ